MNKNYELTLILPADQSQEKALSLLKAMMVKSGGQVSETTSWGVKDLSYPIKKQTRGLYVFFNLQLSPTQATELDKRLRLAEEIVRYLLVVSGTKVISKPTLKVAKVKKELKNGRAKSK